MESEESIVILPPREDQEGSSKSSTVSSIEALNWSDLEDEHEASGVDSALLQSIHSQASDDNCGGMGTSSSSQQTVGEQGVSEVDTLNGEFSTVELTSLNQVKQGMKRKRQESPLTSCKIPTVGSNEMTGDSSSNAAVLDDGPIWAKGRKRYKFEENRRINQKLTFGVLFSVVLALGLGLGNLVAYNECEADHKAAEAACPMSKVPSHSVSNIPPQTPPASSAKKVIQPTKSTVYPTTDPSASLEVTPTSSAPVIPTSDAPELSKDFKPMVDPKYAHHIEQLSRVLKMLDELSRKIDKFENTTRQLGGLVMMKYEIENKPQAKNTNFLQILSEFMQTKEQERKSGKEDPKEVKTWRHKKEEVLEEIAEAVLEAMKDDEDLELDYVEKNEMRLEDRHVFPLDENIEPKATSKDDSKDSFHSTPELTPSSGTGIPSNNVYDSSAIPAYPRPSPKEKEKSDENSDFDKTEKVSKPKLKRSIAIDLDDGDAPMKEPKHGRDTHFGKKYEFKQKMKKSNQGRKQYSQSSGKGRNKETDWDTTRANQRKALRREAEQYRRNWQLERDYLREQFRSPIR